MIERLTSPDAVEKARSRIEQLLDERGEWFYTKRQTAPPPLRRDGARAPRHVAFNSIDGEPFSTRRAETVSSRVAETVSASEASGALRKGEWELREAHGALLLSLLTERGARLWRIVAWEWTGERLLLEATRRAGAERATLELVPRASASAASALLLSARRALCERLATLFAASIAGAKVESVALSRGARRGQPGRYARILLSTKQERVAVAATVSETGTHETDAFLTSALVWFARLAETTRDRRPLRLALVATRSESPSLGEHLSLLRGELRSVVSLFETDDARETLAPSRMPELEALLADAPRFSPPAETALSRAAQEIIALAPDAIDVVRARRGETLRFHGLPFARVRRLLGREQVWFGVEPARRTQSLRQSVSRRLLLTDENRAELFKLLDDLNAHRHPAADNRQHALYRAAPEAWLESLLRRDISRLDPGLRLSPLHAQFRTSGRSPSAASRPIDLLALRRDGRLVVVELKVSEDAALPLQGADYWRRVETQRRSGRLAAARLFGNAPIADLPPLVYLVAPLLSFHRSFNQLARSINPRIEIYRFDINEDWRNGLRVARRCDVT